MQKFNKINWSKSTALFAIGGTIFLALAGILGSRVKNRKTSDKEILIKNIISRTLTSHTLEEAVKNILIEIGRLLDADRVHFRLYDPSINIFSKVIEEYKKDESIPSSKSGIIHPKDFDKFLREQIFNQKKIFFINDPNAPEYPESFKELFKSLSIKNEMIIPVFYDNKPEGAFFITNTEYAKQWSQKDIEELMSIFQQISVGTHLFKLNDSLMKASNYDRILREIIYEVRQYGEPEDVFKYLICRLPDLFHIDRVLDLKMDQNKNLYVFNEELKDKSLGNLKGEIIFYTNDYQELSENMENQIITINDVSELKVSELRENLKHKRIEAFLLYQITETIPELKKEQVTNRIMLCSSSPRLWTSDEIDALKLIFGAISIVFVEIKRRLDIIELRNLFLATLTHDLRSPILAEQKALEAILSKRFGASLENYSEYLEDIASTNEDLLKIINNILTIQHFDSGSFHLNLNPSSIKSVANDAVTSIQSLAKERDSNINVIIPENLPVISIDSDEIKRVLVNLLSNAVKHNPKGTEINISAEKINEGIKVSISDNGKGIPEDERSKIFERYPTEKRKIGTGLGLYLSKQIIDMHNGKIWFESEEGKGTTFYFTLCKQ